MGTRADLLTTAEALAAAAREKTQRAPDAAPGWSGHVLDNAAAMAAAAKTALEAAALAENVSASQIDQALDAIQELLAEAGVLDERIEHDVPTFLARTFQALLAWRREALAAQGYSLGYDRLRELLERLEQDFLAGDTAVSLRIAGRIRGALDDATQIINSNAIGGPEDGQAG